jgi:hypothetical protein
MQVLAEEMETLDGLRIHRNRGPSSTTPWLGLQLVGSVGHWLRLDSWRLLVRHCRSGRQDPSSIVESAGEVGPRS